MPPWLTNQVATAAIIILCVYSGANHSDARSCFRLLSRALLIVLRTVASLVICWYAAISYNASGFRHCKQPFSSSWSPWHAGQKPNASARITCSFHESEWWGHLYLADKRYPLQFFSASLTRKTDFLKCPLLRDWFHIPFFAFCFLIKRAWLLIVGHLLYSFKW